jgi:beta-N-acetylhexosaminidase
MGDRSFGPTAALVARMAGAVALGLLQNGLIPCAKHFPGHGDTRVDSHLDLPVIDHEAERLQSVELEPFRQLVRMPIPMIMTAHVLVPAVDARWPATLSNAWITGVLRRELKYGGVVVSDDLEMQAIADRYSIEETVERGLHAGLDVLLVCRSREKARAAWEHLVRLGQRSEAEREMIAMAAGRVRKLKRDYLRPWTPPEDLGARLATAAHQRVIDAVQAAASAARDRAEG